MVHHHLQGADLQALALELADVDEEHAEPVRLLRELVHRGGAREQQHEVRLEHPRDEHLLPVDHVGVALAHRGRLQLGGVGARVGLGDPEGLQAKLAGGDLGQVPLLLLGGAVPQERAHDVHLGVAGRRVAPRAVDLLQDQRGLQDAQPAAAVLLRNQHREVAGLGQLVDEGLGILAAGVEIAPVLGRVLQAQVAHGGLERFLLFGEDEAHVRSHT